MLFPAAMAFLTEDFATGRRFFYASLMTMIAATLIGIATQGSRVVATERRQLVTLVASYLVLPVVLAIPMEQAVSATRFINVYLDMVSALTTTGAVVFEPGRLPDAVHLWRGTVGWLGGLLIWVSAMAVLAPLSLGGYEVTSEARVEEGRIQTSLTQTGASGAADRLRKERRAADAGLRRSDGCACLRVADGGRDGRLVAVIHAMSTMATSGITPVDGLIGRPAGGGGGEAMILISSSSSRCRGAPFSRRFVPRLARHVSRRTGRSGWPAFAVVVLADAFVHAPLAL